MAGARAGQGTADRPAASDLHGRAHARVRATRAALSRGRYTLTVRRRGTTERQRFGGLGEALAALEARLDALVTDERRGRERALAREYEPVAQVAIRGEVAGPGGLRGGVDVRGDGSAEAFTGRWRRQVVSRRAGETAYEALRRTLAD